MISVTLICSPGLMGQVGTAAMRLNQELEARRLVFPAWRSEEINNLLRGQQLEQAGRREEVLHGLTSKQRKLLRRYQKTHSR